MSQSRILIVLEDGQFKGASQQDGSLAPQPLDLAAVTALLPALNASAIARANEADEAIAAAHTERDEALAEIDQIAAEIAKPQPDPAKIAAALTRAKMPAAARQKAELERQIAELQRQRDEMDTPGGRTADARPSKPI